MAREVRNCEWHAEYMILLCALYVYEAGCAAVAVAALDGEALYHTR